MRHRVGLMLGGSAAVVAAMALAVPARQVTAPALHAASATLDAPPTSPASPSSTSVDSATSTDSTSTGSTSSLSTSTSPLSTTTASTMPASSRSPAVDPAGARASRATRADDRGADGAGGAVSWLQGPPPADEQCPAVARSVVIDRRWQRAWVCIGGDIATIFPVTTARDQPDPGDYTVYARDWRSFSDQTPRRAWLDRFIAFSRGKHEGLRIGFHAVPYYEGGKRLQPLSSVGSLDRFGASDGCIRVRPEHAELLWQFLREGDVVRVLT